jgi:c(7)-type cytochrome triheme protein
VHPDINCATCHDVGEGGALGAAFHFSFSAKEDLVSERCLGCHKDKLDKPVGIEAAAKSRPDNELIRIPHEKHVKELGIKCTYCHYNVFHERRPVNFATFRPTMEACYTCHDAEKTPCESCHPNGLPSGVSMSGKVGGGKISYHPKSSGEVVFNHKKHMGKGLTCDSCHPAVFKMRKTEGEITMARMYEGKDCGHCHNGMGAFASDDCGRCHMGGVKSGGEMTYKMEGFGPVVFSHDNHIAQGLKCGQCHTAIFGFQKTSGRMTMDKINKGKFCGGCHNGKKAFGADACDSCHRAG